MPRRPNSSNRRGAKKPPSADSLPRIIGGSHRGRKLPFVPGRGTRPMKHRTREAVFNMLGNRPRGAIAVDLFAGTGALGFEAISRGAARAIFVESDRALGDAITRSAKELGESDRCEVRSGDALAFLRGERPSVEAPWLVFVCPPYALYDSVATALDDLLERLVDSAPAESLLIVETPLEFQVVRLPAAYEWDVRRYPPALIAIGENESAGSP